MSKDKKTKTEIEHPVNEDCAICARCRHLIINHYDEPKDNFEPDDLYKYFCGKHPLPVVLHPISGEKVYKVEHNIFHDRKSAEKDNDTIVQTVDVDNDHVRIEYQDHPYMPCLNINFLGDCPDFDDSEYWKKHSDEVINNWGKNTHKRETKKRLS